MKSRKIQPYLLNLGGTSVQVLSGNERRVGLIITPGQNQAIAFGFGESAVIDKGLFFRPATSTFYVGIEHIGDAIKLPIHAIAGGGQTTGLVEIIESGD